MRVLEIPKDDSINEVIKRLEKNKDGLECVIVLAIKKDGSQWLETSKASGEQRAFLLQFFQAWITKWFNIGDICNH
jgi:hypothetical protein